MSLCLGVRSGISLLGLVDLYLFLYLYVINKRAHARYLNFCALRGGMGGDCPITCEFSTAISPDYFFSPERGCLHSCKILNFCKAINSEQTFHLIKTDFYQDDLK